jgi:lantibiotic modifying enzyme
LAFQYERTLFDSHSGNWPDFREQPSRGGLAKNYCVFWCHGAPGIGLSRLRAYSLLGEPILRDEALAAIRTTSCAIESALSAGTENYSLCHGLTGDAELLLQAARVLGPEMACRDLSVAVADVGIRSYAPSGRWPCGSGSGETPNLMLGLAGIGHFYLRLHDPRVPSILMPLSEDFVEGRSESATRKFTTPILNHPKKEEIHAEVEKFGGDREVGRPQRRCDSTA